MHKASGCIGFVLLLSVIGQPPTPAYAQHEVLYASTLGLSGTALLDIFTAPVSAARYNKKHGHLSPAMTLRDGSLRLATRFSFNRARPIGAGFVLGNTPSEKRKSGIGAFLLSASATVGPMLLGAVVGESRNGEVVGILLFTGGLVVGPSVGHWYAGQTIRGWVTVGLRGVFLALFLAEIDDFSFSD